MVAKKSHEQAEAKRLRREGHTIPEIAKQLGVSKGSVSAWVRGIVLTEDEKQKLLENKERARMVSRFAGGKRNREKHLELRKAYQEAGRIKAQEGSRLHLIGCMLYWAEGAKRRNHLHFVNSDVEMLRLFQRFLYQELNVQPDEIRLQIHVHDEGQITQAETYWLKQLDLPQTALMKTQVKEGSETRRNRLEHGVCAITLNNTEVVMHIYGAIQEYAGFENPAWLF